MLELQLFDGIQRQLFERASPRIEPGATARIRSGSSRWSAACARGPTSAGSCTGARSSLISGRAALRAAATGVGLPASVDAATAGGWCSSSAAAYDDGMVWVGTSRRRARGARQAA
jgi:hypothetical protein